jgi:hypothetical protein
MTCAALAATASIGSLAACGGVIRSDDGGGNTLRTLGFGLPERPETRWAYVFLLPFLVGFLVITGGPMVASLVLSFTQYDVLNPAEFVGIENYREAVADPAVFRSLANTIYYTVLHVPLSVGIALALAMLLRRAGRSAGLLPYGVLPPRNDAAGRGGSAVPAAAQRPGRSRQRLPRPVRHRGTELDDRSGLDQAGNRPDEPVEPQRQRWHLPRRTQRGADGAVRVGAHGRRVVVPTVPCGERSAPSSSPIRSSGW